MSKKKISVAVIGATGFTGLDLVFLLTKHTSVNIKYLCATKNLGKNISFFDKISYFFKIFLMLLFQQLLLFFQFIIQFCLFLLF